jgi:hypothetical protein
MALFRDRRVFPRWAFIDSRSLPRPRYAKDGTSAESVPTPPDAPSELDSAPEVEVHREPQPVPAPSVRTAEVWLPEAQPQRAIPQAAPVSWIAERRNWFAEHDWPTQPSDEAVQLASTHPDLPYVAPPYPGLPAVSPAEVRARHGRGFSSLTRRRRRRHHGHEQPGRRTDIDLVALEVALDAATSAIGDGLLHVVVWHAATGLALASRGNPSPELAAVWHGATREVRATLPHADLPAAGSYHLVGLEDRRLAVLVHADPDLGACLMVDLDVVAVDTLLATAVPQLRGALAATSREY